LKPAIDSGAMTNTYKKSDKSAITFPNQQCWNPDTGIATIAVQVGSKRILCRIAMSVLKKKYRISSNEPMHNITQYRASIEAAAKMKIEDQVYEDDGSITINYIDL